MNKLLHYINLVISAVIKHIVFIAAGILAISWYVSTKELEPVITMLLILAGIIDFYITRQGEFTEKRRVLLHALVYELYINLNMINDSKFNPNHEEATKFVTFPRVQRTAIQACVISGAFVQEKDKTLFNLMHSWNGFSAELNNRLNLTEQAMLLNSTPENINVWRTNLKGGQTFINIKESVTKLSKHLLEYYKNESGIDSDTLLFKQ